MTLCSGVAKTYGGDAERDVDGESPASDMDVGGRGGGSPCSRPVYIRSLDS